MSKKYVYSTVIWDPIRRRWIKVGSSDGAMVHYGTVQHWDEQRTLRSEKNTIYVYKDWKITKDDPPSYIPGIKIGDGNAYLIDLPFITGDYQTLEDHLQEVEEKIDTHMADTSIHVTPTEKTFWNNKSRISVRDETLICEM